MDRDLLERLFFAVEVGAQARSALAAYLHRVAPGGLPGRAVPPANWHLTLRFLGGATAAQRTRAEAACSFAHEAFTVRLTGPGAFPRPARAAVLWVGVADPRGDLARLAQAAEQAARAAGFPAESRPFRPHLTVARMHPAADVAPLLQRAPPAAIPLPVERVVLMRSLAGATPRYQPVAAWPLVPPRTP